MNIIHRTSIWNTKTLRLILEGKMPKTAINLVLKWLEEHKEELIENWERIERKEQLNKIEPLT